MTVGLLGTDGESLGLRRPGEIDDHAQIAIGLSRGAQLLHEALAFGQHALVLDRRGGNVDDDAIRIIEGQHACARPVRSGRTPAGCHPDRPTAAHP